MRNASMACARACSARAICARCSLYLQTPIQEAATNTMATATAAKAGEKRNGHQLLDFTRVASAEARPASTAESTRCVKSGPGSFRRNAAARSSSEKCIAYLSNSSRQLAAELFQRAMKRALYRVHRHLHDF